MGYTILDILDKLIKVETHIKDVYLRIAELTGSRRIEIVAKILAKDKQRHLEYYNGMKEENSLDLDENIAFDIYDKISFLINQFNTRIIVENFDTLEDLLKYAIQYEEMNKALLIDMQGRLLRKKSDNNTIAYKVLSEVIVARQNSIKNISNFINSK